MDCNCHTFMSGKGYYKYNTSLISNGEYVNMTKQSVLDIIQQPEDQNFDHRQTREFTKVMFESISIKHLCRLANSLKNEISILEKSSMPLTYQIL